MTPSQRPGRIRRHRLSSTTRLRTLASGLVLCAVAACTSPGPSAPPEFAEAPAALRLNQLQVVGTHNSYAQPADPRLLDLVAPEFEKLMRNMRQAQSGPAAALFADEHPHDVSLAEALSYRHPDLATQLDAGARSLEIDVFPDPQGGLFLDPAGYRALRAKGVTDLAPHDRQGLEAPGFKVLHIPDIDFRSHCPSFRRCLQQMKDWSDRHPGHVPIHVLLETKFGGLPILPQPTQTVAWTPALFDAVDQEILSVLGRERLVTPDDVRGDFPTLNAAVLAGRWPLLDSVRGKFVFLMITATGPAGTKAYLQGHASLRGRVAFVRAYPGEDHAAFLMFDNALTRASDIRQAVRQGYLVRTRSDIETYEAKVNDPTRANAALASGAQVISTDFLLPGNVYGTPYQVQLPGGRPARCNPLLAPDCKLAGVAGR